MSQMAFATDGGIVSQPYKFYSDNRATYQFIAERLDQTRSSYLDSDPHSRLRLLFDSATYALLTANTPLKQADRAFSLYRDHYPECDVDHLATTFAENGIGFYNNKAQYIRSNADMIDEVFLPVDRALVDSREEEAQQLLLDAAGIGPAKSAFTLSMLGFTKHVCLDTHTCQQLGIDPREYDKYSADQYKEMADRAFQQIPDLYNEVSPFVCQWVLFDLNRGEIETHDHWFQHVHSVL